MNRLFGHVYAIGGLLVVIVFAMLTCIPVLPFVVLPRGRRERYAIWGARWFCWMCLRPLLFTRIDARGLDNLPKKPGYLIVCNHRSWTDVALLILTTSSQGVSKKEVSYIPFFGLNGWVSGAIFFDRADKEARRAVADDARLLLRGGANLHVFPEGTRTRDGHLREKVQLRLAAMAYENQIPVLPAVVWGTEAALPADAFRAYPGARIGVEVGPPVDPAAHPDADAFAAAVWSRVKHMAAERGVA